MPHHPCPREFASSIAGFSRLMQQAQKAAGLQTKRATVDYALKLVVRLDRQQRIRHLRGKLDRQGDLDAMRLAKQEPVR